jgi:hypothetical protein
MTNIPRISTARQYRFLKALATGIKLGVRDVETIAGCNHASAEKRDLIELGWPIQREIIVVKDRDGRQCRPSLFYLPDKEWQNKARTACKRWKKERAARTALPTQGGLLDDSQSES